MADFSSFEQEFGQAADELQGMFGEPITFDGISCTAIIERPEIATLGPQGVHIESQVVITISKTDVPAASVARGKTVVIPQRAGSGTTETREVRRIIEQNGYSWKLAL